MNISASTPRSAIALIATVAAVLWSAPGVAAATMQETRAVSGSINSVRLVGPIDLSISQGETRGVMLEGNADELAKVRVEVSSGEMTVRFEQGATGWVSIGSHRAPRATVALPELRKVAVVGSGDVTMSPFVLNEGKLEIEVTGSGDVKLSSLKAKSLSVNIRGSGDVAASGQVGAQNIAIAGSGDYAGNDLQSQTSAISIKGSGDAAVWATETLAVSIAGSGDVSYRGQPKLSQSIAGSGEVHQVR
ncbi:MAG: DUF2807 domain-containing protein [Rhodocyclaceae bacterium]|nr:DUF2807 domain-containing protein [Rhodocyclaceae bacterium]